MMCIVDDPAFNQSLLKFNRNINAIIQEPCMVMRRVKMLERRIHTSLMPVQMLGKAIFDTNCFEKLYHRDEGN